MGHDNEGGDRITFHALSVGACDFTPVLMYHDVAATRSARGFRRFVVPPALFAEHLCALEEAGYSTGQVTELAAKPVSPKTAFLTFDDGFGTIVEHALPALAERAMTATLFLPAAQVGRSASWLSGIGEGARQLLSWSDARDASAAGFEIGSHGLRHLELDVLGDLDLERELVVSKAVLEEQILQTVRSLAYPYGYHDARVRSVASQAGYTTACEVGYGLHRSGSDPLRVRRLFVGPDMSGVELLRLIAEGQTTIGQRARVYTRPAWRLARRTRAAFRGPQAPTRSSERP